VSLLAYAAYRIEEIVRMPLKSYTGQLKPLGTEESAIREQLLKDVTHLATTIGERNLGRYSALNATTDYLEHRLRELGYDVARQTYEVSGREATNIEVTVAGGSKGNENLVVGAHYDSVLGTPGANDNGTGVAAVLELARILKSSRPQRTIRFVLFVNEEPPYFQTADMGSLVYARRLRQQNVTIKGMIAVETIGCYSDGHGSQHYPPGIGLLYPDTGNFIAFVGNTESRALVRDSIKAFRDNTEFPSEGAAAPGALEGVGWSDHWSFWEQGWPAIMVTDTAPFRYQHYHRISDTPDKIDFNRTARVVVGLKHVVLSLANKP
jgi:Zn-dependent M28 family amino/carboxypeptidase